MSVEDCGEQWKKSRYGIFLTNGWGRADGVTEKAHFRQGAEAPAPHSDQMRISERIRMVAPGGRAAILGPYSLKIP